ncbi:4-dihydrotrisporin dehydrogenase [Chlamydoabsidia padenii]|nr:4-dihydrotrisporin dehydrogenase [Chlamydoabsidia padenii]
MSEQLTYLITGASRGLGLEFIKQLSAKGHTIIATARNPHQSEALVSLIDQKKVIGVTLDTTDIASVKAAFDKIQTIAPHGIDVLINNSGISGPRDQDVLNATPDNYLDVFNTNVVGTSNVTQAALPLLRQKQTRKIINISSILGSVSLNLQGAAAPYYGASKAAENYVSKAFSTALKEENFAVLALHPGWVKTDMGGDIAPLEAPESIAGMIEQIDKLTADKTGTFIDYLGEAIVY